MTSWITKMKATAQQEAVGATDITLEGNQPADANKPWTEQLRDTKETMEAQGDGSDLWANVLDNLVGAGVVTGGVERLATHKIFDRLGVHPKKQTCDVRRRLAREMIKRGWSPCRCWGTNERSFATQVRGYSRIADHEGTPLLPPNTTKAGRRPQVLM